MRRLFTTGETSIASGYAVSTIVKWARVSRVRPAYATAAAWRLARRHAGRWGRSCP